MIFISIFEGCGMQSSILIFCQLFFSDDLADCISVAIS